MTEQNYIPERVAQLNSWNTPTDRWKIWGTDEYREYITEKYGAERYREFGRMAASRPEFKASIDEFLTHVNAPPSVETDWKAKHDALWMALKAEAEKRDWYEEFDEFSKAHGGPDREVAKTVSMEIYFDIKRPYSEDTREVVWNWNMHYSQRQYLVVHAILGELNPAAELFNRDKITTAIQGALGFGTVRLAEED